MLRFSFYEPHISLTVLQSLKILLNMQLNNHSMGSLRSLLLKYNFHFYIYTISTMRRSFILKTVNQISTLFDLGTTDRFFWNEKKKSPCFDFPWNKFNELYSDATENKVDFISTVTQLSIWREMQISKEAEKSWQRKKAH